MMTDILLALAKDPGLWGMITGNLIDPIALIGLVGVGLCVKPWWKVAFVGALWMMLFRLSILMFSYLFISHPYQREFFISADAIIALFLALMVGGAIIAVTIVCLRFLVIKATE